MNAASKTIAVDIMGADRGPDEVLAGIEIALKSNPSLEGIVAVGDQSVIESSMQRLKLTGHPKISIFHASQVITMDDKPIQSLKTKKDSSMVRAVEMVKSGKCGAAVSCGNTGALMACSTLKLRPMDGISKPALASVWPGKDRHFIVLDVGANPQCRPENLVQYALLGNQYARLALGLEKPRIGLLSIGTEEGKGTPLTNQTHLVLKKLDKQINYRGLIEGFQIFEDAVDVVVTDGFTGNVILKTCESLWKSMKDMIREEATRNPLRMCMGLASKGIFNGVRKRLNPDRYAGAPLLGLRGNVLKAHGSSSRHYIANAIGIGLRLVEQDLLTKIQNDIRATSTTIEQAMRDEAIAELSGEPHP
ncbi:MAG: phosphate acyltransferase PlsX [Verrucomicrobia bacterium]|nr:phosphate acyltransferase PlsX [Verrucomicrobiota bacterium]